MRNNFGLDVLYTPYTVDLRLPPPPRPGQPPAGPFGSQPPLTFSDSDAIYRPALYDELELTPWAGTRIVPGVRLDYAKDTRAWDVQPRLVVRQDLHREFPRTTLKGGIGASRSRRSRRRPIASSACPGSSRTSPTTTASASSRSSRGRSRSRSRASTASTTASSSQRLGNVGEGRAFGLETLLRYKPDEHFFGFVAYTLSRSVRKDGPDEPEQLFNFDQTHILTALGSYRLGSGWEIGARFRYVSGSLTTPQTYGFYDATVGSYLPLAGFPPSSQRNPAFHQLDVRVDKTWQSRRREAQRVPRHLQRLQPGERRGRQLQLQQHAQHQCLGHPVLAEHRPPRGALR